MEKYFVYILQSLSDESFYIGFTTHVERRLDEHNNGLSRYTSGKIPWKIVYCEEYNTRQKALKREKFLKSQRNREFYKRLIHGE
jgi:putative endonuclease